ncbi:MAG: CDP-alcohol phosphatidyltransferase family protein [Brevinematales bacterium]|nr:CDP-alcohol phosphatidyltransferase family protein [Brevinematales bacterium]
MDRFITIPNIISLVRIYLTVPIVYLMWKGSEYYIVCLILIIVAYLSDAVDGIIARNFNQVSEWGKVLDPLGDKILSTGLVITFSQLGFLSVIFAFIVILRDFVISLISTKVIKETNSVRQASILGKVTTFVLFVVYTIAMMAMIGLVSHIVVKKLQVVATFLVIVSGVYYLFSYTLVVRKNKNA